MHFAVKMFHFFCLSLFGLLPTAACLNCRVWSKKIVVNIKAIHKCVSHKNIAIKGKKCAIWANTQFRSPASSSSSSSPSPSQHILLYFVRIYSFNISHWKSFPFEFYRIHNWIECICFWMIFFFLFWMFPSWCLRLFKSNQKFMFRFWLWFRFEFETKTVQKYVVCHWFEFDAGVERHKVDGVAVALEMFVTFKK